MEPAHTIQTREFKKKENSLKTMGEQGQLLAHPEAALRNHKKVSKLK